MVVGLAAVQRIGEKLGDALPEGDQEAVARLEAALVVEGLEVVDVQEQQNVFVELAVQVLDAVLGQLGEIRVVVKPRELVLLRALLQGLRFARLVQTPVIDREADRGQGDEEGDIVHAVAGDDLLRDAADDDLLLREGQAALVGQQDVIEAEEAGGQDQDGDIGPVDQKAADIEHHRQEADDLLAAPKVAVGDEDAEGQADQREGDNRHMLQHDDAAVFPVLDQGVGCDRRADDEQEDVYRDQHGVHDPGHDRRDGIAGLREGLQTQDPGIEHAGHAQHQKRDEPALRQPLLPLIEQAEQHQPQADQQEQPVFGRVLYEQLKEVPARLELRDDL